MQRVGPKYKLKKKKDLPINVELTSAHASLDPAFMDLLILGAKRKQVSQVGPKWSPHSRLERRDGRLVQVPNSRLVKRILTQQLPNILQSVQIEDQDASHYVQRIACFLRVGA